MFESIFNSFRETVFLKEDSNLDDASNDSNVKNDNKTNGEDKKLPYLGIYDISILYTFMLVPILKRDKKINN